MSKVIRRDIPLALTFIVSIIVIARSFFAQPSINRIAGIFLGWGAIVIAMTVGLGFITLLRTHISRVMKLAHEPLPYQWIYSLTTLSAMIIFAVVGIGLGTGSSQYAWLYRIWYRPVASISTMVSGFFAISAMYRAFRINSIESVALVIPALLGIMIDAPLGAVLIPGGAPVAEFLTRFVASAAFRGVVAAASMGVLIISIRTIIGQEKGYLPEET
jgi:hypothetical protein